MIFTKELEEGMAICKKAMGSFLSASGLKKLRFSLLILLCCLILKKKIRKQRTCLRVSYHMHSFDIFSIPSRLLYFHSLFYATSIGFLIV